MSSIVPILLQSIQVESKPLLQIQKPPSKIKNFRRTRFLNKVGSDAYCLSLEENKEGGWLELLFLVFVVVVVLLLGPHPRHMEVPRLGVESEL